MSAIEAMNLALEALEWEEAQTAYPSRMMTNAITALREALAEQPAQQKPVIRVNLDMTGAMATLPKTPSESVVEYKPVISDVGTECNIDVEARLFQPKGTGKITLHEPAQQEPVEWGVDWGKAGDIPCVSIIKRLLDGRIEVVAVEYAPYLYTAPPAQRTWVNATTWRGLTDEERAVIIEANTTDDHGYDIWCDVIGVALAIEAKLKEKNCG